MHSELRDCVLIGRGSMYVVPCERMSQSYGLENDTLSELKELLAESVQSWYGSTLGEYIEVSI